MTLLPEPGPTIWICRGFHTGYHTPFDTPDRINYGTVHCEISGNNTLDRAP